jgi:hypothetical protein
MPLWKYVANRFFLVLGSDRFSLDTVPILAVVFGTGIDKWMKQKVGGNEVMRRSHSGVIWRCQEHGVQVKACGHAVTPATSRRRRKGSSSIQGVDFGGGFGTRNLTQYLCYLFGRALRRKLRKH